ncbi:MAG: hypothetical protein K2W86_14630 [Sphingomonas sp.]|nr:hypothetical protein [Sphingomonas sp.]
MQPVTEREVVARQEPEIALAAAEARIAWILDHPHMSDWLKTVLRSTEGCDPIALQNDLDMLRHLIMPRVAAQIEIQVSSASTG